MNEEIVKIQCNSNKEASMSAEVSFIESSVDSIQVTCDAEYVSAGELTKDVKRLQKSVEEYWEPLRVSAKRTYDDVLAKKKQMIDPLKAAEKNLKSKMSEYANAKERQRKAQEEALRKIAAIEIEKKLTEAAEAEKVGDSIAAEVAMAEAEVMEGVSISGSVGAISIKAAGVSQSKSWKITNISSEIVPSTFAGVVIRPVDEKSVMKLIKESHGTITIPGIEYEEVISISVRT